MKQQGGCGKCCPSVDLTEEEAQAILAEYNLQFDDVFRRNNVGDVMTKTVPENIEGGMIQNNCIFLDENKRCSIYNKRPQICRDYQCPECEELWQTQH